MIFENLFIFDPQSLKNENIFQLIYKISSKKSSIKQLHKSISAQLATKKFASSKCEKICFGNWWAIFSPQERRRDASSFRINGFRPFRVSWKRCKHKKDTFIFSWEEKIILDNNVQVTVEVGKRSRNKWDFILVHNYRQPNTSLTFERKTLEHQLDIQNVFKTSFPLTSAHKYCCLWRRYGLCVCLKPS